MDRGQILLGQKRNLKRETHSFIPMMQLPPLYLLDSKEPICLVPQSMGQQVMPL